MKRCGTKSTFDNKRRLLAKEPMENKVKGGHVKGQMVQL
jgi:hypothetical protein